MVEEVKEAEDRSLNTAEGKESRTRGPTETERKEITSPGLEASSRGAVERVCVLLSVGLVILVFVLVLCVLTCMSPGVGFLF